MSQTERLCKIDCLLQARGCVPLDRMLEELGISRAAFKRDIEYMWSRLHVPIEWDRNERGYKYLTLHIILDQGSYCVSMATQAQATRLGIKLWHLPTYSPNVNLNLIERAWKVMNEDVRNNIYFPDAKTFTSCIKDFFLNRWSKLPKSLTTRFADNVQVVQKPAF